VTRPQTQPQLAEIAAMNLNVTLTAAVLAAVTTLHPLSVAAGEAAANPTARPQRNVTTFDEALRCMDRQLLNFGIRDVSVMLEDIPDKTGKLGAGTRDMMVSAISDMTKRSRAVKLVAFGFDNQNIVSFLAGLQRQNQFGLVPQYDIRGALSQFDTDAERRQAGVGFSFANLLGFRIGRDKTVSVLGFDASVVHTADLTLVNGASSKNTMVTIREESGLGDGTATIQKTGISFSTTFTRQDSPAQAVRNLIELATIELIGRLVKVPYWSCLGMSLDSKEVADEVEDWFVGFRSPRDMNAFMQEQLRNRGFFDGPVDGRASEALRNAIAAYGKGIGKRSDGRIDLAYFRAFLLADVPPAPDEPFAVADLNPEQLGELKIELVTKEPRAGAALEIRVTSTTDAYVYCYNQNADGKIQRFFPNRFARDPRIAAGQALSLPGRQPFALRANANGDAHRLACLSASREIYDGLPPPLRWADFEDIGFTSFDDVRQAFANAAKTPINMALLAVPLPGAGVAQGEFGGGLLFGPPSAAHAPQAGFTGLPPQPASPAAAPASIPGVFPAGAIPGLPAGVGGVPAGLPGVSLPSGAGARPQGVTPIAGPQGLSGLPQNGVAGTALQAAGQVPGAIIAQSPSAAPRPAGAGSPATAARAPAGD
jgi:hypothetical protein